METLTQIDFLKQTPKVVYEFYDHKGNDLDITWEFRWGGIFGKGYYQLTKNGRRHPQGKFKVTEQIYREFKQGRCKIKN